MCMHQAQLLQAGSYQSRGASNRTTILPPDLAELCWAGTFLLTSRNPNYDKGWLWAVLCSHELPFTLQAGTSSPCHATLFCLVGSVKRIQIFVFATIFFKCTSHWELESRAGQLANSTISFFLEPEEEGGKPAWPCLKSSDGSVQAKRKNLLLEERNWFL